MPHAAASCLGAGAWAVCVCEDWLHGRMVDDRRVLCQVKYVRPIIHPNERFRLALAKFEMSLFEGRSSVADFHHELWNFFAWCVLHSSHDAHGHALLVSPLVSPRVSGRTTGTK